MNDRAFSNDPANRTDGARQTAALPFHCESIRIVAGTAESVFSLLDDHNRLAGHMSQTSWMMAGTKMNIELDAAKGRATGSRIELRGRVLGVSIHVAEVVTEHQPPHRKAWETTGTPRLLVIGHYMMGFEIAPQGPSSRLRVFIDYDLPARVPERWLGFLLGGFYARWCTQSMANDAAAYFSSTALQKPPGEAAS